MTNSSEIIVAPSLLAADPLNLLKDIKEVEAGGADWHHVDVMDGHFVPNLTYGLPLVSALKKQASIPLDVHIMVANPDLVAAEYVKAGADILSFHVEAAVHSHRIIQNIRELGAKAGIVLNPGTPVSAVFPVLDFVDVVMLMSVNPGFGGQKFIESTYDRISSLRTELQKRNLDGQVVIEVDGGVTDQNIHRLRDAGVGAVVAGSFVFKSSNRRQAIQSLK